MILIWGSYNVGRTDEVPGMFHVTTRFGHLWYIPLIPMGSYLLLDGEEDGEGNPRGMAIPFSFKSFLLAWARAATLLIGIVFMGWGLLGQTVGVDWLRLAEGAVSLGACIWITFGKAFRRATYTRALELGELLGLNEHGKVALDLAMDRISPEEAEAKMAGLIDREQDVQVLPEGNEAAAPPLPDIQAGDAAECRKCGNPVPTRPSPAATAGFCSPECMELA